MIYCRSPLSVIYKAVHFQDKTHGQKLAQILNNKIFEFKKKILSNIGRPNDNLLYTDFCGSEWILAILAVM